MIHNASILEGFHLRAHDGSIGKIKDFYFDDESWRIRYFVVKAGTWLKRNEVLISPVSIRRVNFSENEVAVDLTREQVAGSPGIDEDQPLSRQLETRLHMHYGWPAYWGKVSGEATYGTVPPAAPATANPKMSDYSEEHRHRSTVALAENHPRSIRAISGYRIEATDGGIGRIDDFLIDDASWEIRHLVVDTRHWRREKRVLVAPRWISALSWEQRAAVAGVNKEAIETSPEYDPKSGTRANPTA